VLPVAATLIVLAPELLRAWLGPALATQALAARIFISYWILWVNVPVALQLLIGTGRLRFMLWFTLGQAALNLVLSIVLVRHFQVLGVILGTVTANLVLFPVVMRYSLRALDVGTGSWLKRVVAPTYPLLALPVAVGFASIAAGLTTTLLGVALAGLLSVAAYWSAFYFFGLAEAERSDIFALFDSIRSRFAGTPRA
jgi:O-antigen/teichoic acid export membrane protein